MIVSRWIAVFLAGLAMPSASSGAPDPMLQRQNAVLAVIEARANGFCMPVSDKTTTNEIHGNVEARLQGLVGRLVHLGLLGSAGGRSITSSGVLQKDLAAAIRQRDTCKVRVLETLAKYMLPAVQPPVAESSPKPGPAAQASAGIAPRSAPTVPAPSPKVSVSVQFYPKVTTGDFKDIEVEPCVQTDRRLVCTIFVTQNGGRGPSWMAYKQSTIQDENGADIAPSLITVGGVNVDPQSGGRRVPLTMGTRTRVVYVYDGVADAKKLQTFNITVCCTHNISLHPQ